jgi:putative oxidoreductase
MRTINEWIESLTRQVDLPARMLMALLLLLSGFGKVTAVAATQTYMAAYGVPGMLVWPAAAMELTTGVLLVVGLAVRPVSVVLAGWCFLTAAIFHAAWSDQTQLIMFFKNMTMAGGFLMLAKSGSWRTSIDALVMPRPDPAVASKR